MKQTISIIYPPPQPYKNNNNKCNKTPQKLNGFQCGPLTGRHPPHPNHTHTHLPPAFLSSFFVMQHLKHSNDIRWRADGCSTLCAGWDRVCSCLVPPSSSFALKHFLMFCKTLVRKMHIIIQQNISCDVVIIA